MSTYFLNLINIKNQLIFSSHTTKISIDLQRKETTGRYFTKKFAVTHWLCIMNKKTAINKYRGFVVIFHFVLICCVRSYT